MKIKQINGKITGNSLESRRKSGIVEKVSHAAKTLVKTALAAGALGVFLTGTALAASGEDAYQIAEGTESYADVYDMADLFTDEEEKQLSGQAQVLSDTMKMEAVIVTTGRIPTPPRCSWTDFTWKAVSEPVPTTRGILFLIDMDNRELYISTNGQMIRYMTDSRINDVLDDVYNYAADADYYGAAAAAP